MRKTYKENCYSIYLVTFPSGKQYVGLTGNSLEKRKKEHYKKSANKLVHKAIKKYAGEEIWALVSTGLSLEEACAKEQALIASLGTKSPGGYNLTDGGEGPTGYVPTREAVAKSVRAKEFECYTINDEYVGTWLFQSDCVSDLNLPINKISSCLSGHRRSSCSYKFKYPNEDFKWKPKPSKPSKFKGIPRTAEVKSKISKATMGKKKNKTEKLNVNN